MPRLLDLFCGRWGWSRAFAERGWECVGIDLTEPPKIPKNCHFVHSDVLTINVANDETDWLRSFDFICASSPCEEFSVHGMKHFHPNPKYPENGIRLFNHTWALCEASGVPFVMENVRAAQAFVGNAVHHCGPFYLWGSGVPPILNQNIKKGWGSYYIDANGRKRLQGPTGRARMQKGEKRHSRALTANVATIPPELANCVADYAERLLEQRIESPA